MSDDWIDPDIVAHKGWDAGLLKRLVGFARPHARGREVATGDARDRRLRQQPAQGLALQDAALHFEEGQAGLAQHRIEVAVVAARRDAMLTSTLDLLASGEHAPRRLRRRRPRRFLHHRPSRWESLRIPRSQNRPTMMSIEPAATSGALAGSR